VNGRPRTIREVLDAAVARAPDKPYLLFEDRAITYAELRSRVDRAANAFRELGIRTGDRVSLMLPNAPPFLECWLGLNSLGASMVPVNTAFRAREARYVVDHSESRLLVADARYLDIAREAGAKCRLLDLGMVVVGTRPDGERVEPGDERSYEALLAAATDTPVEARLDEDDEASILYTSGTTGNPKGCVEEHSYYLLAARVYARTLGLGPEDRVLTPLPLFHMNPQILSTMGTLLTGGSLVLLDRFHPGSWWDEVRRFRPTVFHYLGVMPAMLMGLPERPDDRDQPARIGIGAGVPPDLHARFEERFGCQLLEVFGMTEVGLNFCCPPGPDRRIGTRCFCRVFPEYEARVVDDEDRDLAPSGVGELLLRGSDPARRRLGFMREYLKNPAATAQAWRGGWFHTGDFVTADADGWYSFVDRKRDIVRRSGENISTSEVEAVLRAHPAVVDAAVIPVPDPIREEEVKAYIVLQPEHTPETAPPEALLRWCEERLAYFKVPRYLEYRDGFPRTPTEKVQKQALKAEREDLTIGCYDRLAADRPAPRERSGT
jgi:carnitine-CoA ligase